MKYAPRNIIASAGDLFEPKPDGTYGTPVGPLSALYQSHARAADEREDTVIIDASLAAKIAVLDVILGSVIFAGDYKPLLTGRGEKRSAQVYVDAKGLHVDWPEATEDKTAIPHFTVREMDGGLTYETVGLGGADFIDETLDVYGPGTCLVLEHDVSGELIVETELADRTTRHAVRRALLRAFSREPSDLRGGRRVLVRPYYDRTCRIELARQAFPATIDPTDAHRQTLPLMCVLEVDIQDVRLVDAEPIYVTPPVPEIRMGTDLDLGT